MKGIREQEDKLFQAWKSSESIIKDGVIDEDRFLLMDIKILVILKDPRGSVNKEKDLRIFLRNEAPGHTWNNIVRWTYGLQNINQDVDLLWKDISVINKLKRKEGLLNISSINLKKQPGKGKAKPQEIEEATLKFQDNLKEQIDFYTDIDFILCGSILVKNLISCNLIENLTFKKHKQTYVEIAEYNKILIISYYHPNARGQSKKMFYDLIKSVQDYKNDKNNTFI